MMGEEEYEVKSPPVHPIPLYKSQVERILEKRVEKNGYTEYLVKWRNYEVTSLSWLNTSVAGRRGKHVGAAGQPGGGGEGHQAVREGAGAEEPVCREGPGPAEQEETNSGGLEQTNTTSFGCYMSPLHLSSHKILFAGSGKPATVQNC